MYLFWFPVIWMIDDKTDFVLVLSNLRFLVFDFVLAIEHCVVYLDLEQTI